MYGGTFARSYSVSIFGVRHREKSLLVWVVFLAFSKKTRQRRSGCWKRGSRRKVSQSAISLLDLQTRAPWTEVELAQMNESCLAGVQKVLFGPRDRESPKSHLRRCKQGLRPCNPMLRQCNEPFVPISAKTFCALSEALWARSADLTSVPGGLVCNTRRAPDYSSNLCPPEI